MAKVLRTHQVKSEYLVQKVQEEILLLTRGVACPECVEIVFESGLYERLGDHSAPNGGPLFYRHRPDDETTVMGFKYRVVSGLGARSGSMAVLIRSEVVFK